jgi:hypothetical protein
VSDFSDLDSWLGTELVAQAPVSRQMRPATEPIPTLALLGYLALWHNRTCDACGSEHVEFVGAYECYRLPSGGRSLKLCATLPSETLLPILHRQVRRTAQHCSECYTPTEPTPEIIATLSTFESLLQ